MNRVILFQDVGVVDALLVLLCVIAGFEVHYLLVDRRVSGLMRLLHRSGRVRPVDYEKCERLNPRFFHDENPLKFAGVDEWSRMAPLLRGLYPLFPGITDIETKMIRWLGDSLRDDNMEPGSPLCAWIDGYLAPGRPVTIVSPHRHTFERHVDLPDHKITVLTVWSPASLITLFFRSLFGHMRSAASRILALADGASVTPAAEPGTDEHSCFDARRFVALFFPHKGVAYGKLYAKDQFYSPDPASPLHPDNICHVEHDLDVAARPGRLGSGSNPYILGPIGIGSKLKAFRAFLPALWRLHASGGHRIGPRSLRHIGLIFRLYSQYHFYRAALAPFSQARVAFVGYDILFPRPLSLALESCGIRTIACEERTIHSSIEASFIVDTYLCGSPFFGDLQVKYGVGVARQFVPVGLIRSDLLHRYKNDPLPADLASQVKGRKLAVVLDYASVTDPDVNRRCPIVNWRANRAFIEDILRLARLFPDTFFMFRGKNADWLNLPVFQDLVAEIGRAGNIGVDSNYERANESYRLCVHADIVIAKYTSIGTECLSFGIPVLFYDYLPNAKSIFGHAFDFLGSACMVHDYERLESLTRSILTDKVNPFTLEEAETMRHIFGTYNDGHVVERVLSFVESEIGGGGVTAAPAKALADCHQKTDRMI